MKKVLITFDCNNGYSCSCCGRWWEETEEFEIEDDVDPKEFVENKKEECKRNIGGYGRMDIDSAYLISEKLI